MSLLSSLYGLPELCKPFEVFFVRLRLFLLNRRREKTNIPDQSQLEFDRSGPPTLLQPGLQRSVEAENHEPRLTTEGLQPPLSHASMGLGVELVIGQFREPHRTCLSLP